MQSWIALFWHLKPMDRHTHKLSCPAGWLTFGIKNKTCLQIHTESVLRTHVQTCRCFSFLPCCPSRSGSELWKITLGRHVWATCGCGPGLGSHSLSVQSWPAGALSEHTWAQPVTISLKTAGSVPRPWRVCWFPNAVPTGGHRWGVENSAHFLVQLWGQSLTLGWQVAMLLLMPLGENLSPGTFCLLEDTALSSLFWEPHFTFSSRLPFPSCLWRILPCLCQVYIRHTPWRFGIIALFQNSYSDLQCPRAI